MTIAVDMGRKATNQTNKQTKLSAIIDIKSGWGNNIYIAKNNYGNLASSPNSNGYDGI